MKKRTAVKKSDPAAKRKRRRISRFHLVVTLFVAILVLGGATVFMLLFMPGSSSNDQPAVFAVKSVEVVGDTRYSREAIIGVSGIKVGQSVFSVDKRKASEKIREAFPYIDYIDIGNSSFDTVTIQVRETEVLGARYAEGYWYVVGANGRAVEALPVESDRPPRYIYFKGVTPETCALGGEAMDERSMGIVETLLKAFEETAAAAKSDGRRMDLTTGIVEIDMTDKSDILQNAIRMHVCHIICLRHGHHGILIVDALRSILNNANGTVGHSKVGKRQLHIIRFGLDIFCRDRIER